MKPQKGQRTVKIEKTSTFVGLLCYKQLPFSPGSWDKEVILDSYQREIFLLYMETFVDQTF